MKILHLQKNTKGNDYIVGDLHGCYQLLRQALYEIPFDPEVDRIICTGDLVDRGPDSELCLTLLDQPWFFSVMGNHDAMLCGAAYEFAGNTVSSPRVPSWESDSIMHPQNGAQWLFNALMHQPGRCKTLASKLELLPDLIVLETEAGRKYVCHAELDVTANLLPEEFLVTDSWLDELLNTPEIERKALLPIPDYLTHIRWMRQFGTLAKNKTDRNFDDLRSGTLGTVFAGHTPVETVTRLAGYMFLDLGAYSSQQLGVVDARSEQVYNIQYDAFKPQLDI